MYRNKQKGAAAIFVVVFFAILIGIITLSFFRIVNQDQQLSLNNDLSQSAHDSAQAGVEDSMRAIAVYENCRAAAAQGDATAASCVEEFESETGALDKKDCKAIKKISSKIGIDVADDNEVKVQASATEDAELNQAYTCVNIDYHTSDVLASPENGQSVMYELKPSNAEPFDKIKILWDDPSRNKGHNYALEPLSSMRLPRAASDWNKPPILRAQLIYVPNTNISLPNLQNDTWSVFLYPTSGTVGDNNYSPVQARQVPKADLPKDIPCHGIKEDARYSCGVTFTNLTAGTATGRYFLRLGSFYANADVKIQMLKNNGSVVSFDGVQPAVDVTGKANNVFRRIQTRVEPKSEPQIPAGLDFSTSDSLCKIFRVGTELDHSDTDRNSAFCKTE